MIRDSIEPGTKVWHADFGLGKFEKRLPGNGVVIEFEDYTLVVNRKCLTEVEE